jgi:hypothetical protein
MLAAEAALFLWTSERIAGSMPAQSPRRLAVLVASDVGTALADNPTLDLEKYVDEQYGHIFQTFIIIMRDGRVASNHEDVAEELLEEARAEGRFGDFARRGRFGGTPAPNGPIGPPRQNDPNAPNDPNGPNDLNGPNDPRRGRRPGGLRPPPFRGAEVAAVVVSGMPVGRVAVLTGSPPFRRIVR